MNFVETKFSAPAFMRGWYPYEAVTFYGFTIWSIQKGHGHMNKPVIFAVGAAAGATAALLLSPNSGERNREIVADKVDYYSAHGEQIIQQAADAVRSKVGGAEDTAAPAADDIRQKINEARDRIAEQITRNSAPQDVDADVADVAEEVAEAVEEVAEEAAEEAAEDAE